MLFRSVVVVMGGMVSICEDGNWVETGTALGGSTGIVDSLTAAACVGQTKIVGR